MLYHHNTAKNWHKHALTIAVSAILAPAVGAQEAAEKVYEEVIVTGQKVSRSLQDTPASVAVVDSLSIEQQELGSLEQTLQEIPNVHNTNGLSIRGIDGFNVSGAGSGALASVYVDNSPLNRRLIANSVSTWDISQVEVLRGPQSTLQGRNALAGAVVMTSEKPTQEWNGRFRLEAGENGQQEAAIAVGGGIIEDQLAFRFSAETEEFDGFNYNITRKEDSGFREDDLYRLKLLYTPSALPELSVQFNFTHTETARNVGGVNVPTDGSNPYKHRIVTNNDPQILEYDADIIALDINYELSNHWTLSAITTQSEIISSWDDLDDDNGPEAGGTRFYKEEAKTTSQELRFNFEYDNLTGVLGAYYYKQELPSNYGGISRLALASVGLSAPVLQARFGLDADTANFVVAQYAPLNPAVLSQENSTHIEVETQALFADATYSINDKWDLLAGLRWDKETGENESATQIRLANAEFFPNPALYPTPLNQLIGGINAQLQASVEAANGEEPLTDASFTEVIPKLGVSYRWSDDITTSLILQRGYRSGGVGVNTAQARSYTYDPEFTDNVEFSLRSQWLDGALTVNANVFYIDWTDQQVTIQLSSNTFDNEVRNAGSSEVKGFELETSYILTEEWSFNAAVGQAKSEFKEFDVIIPTQGESIVRDLSGRSFADAPEWTANAGVTYTGNSGIFANLSVNYADSSPALVDPYSRGLNEGDASFDPENEGRTLVNLRAGYEWEKAAVYLVAKNLLDEEYISFAPYGFGRRVERQGLGDPRQLSLVVRGSF